VAGISKHGLVPESLEILEVLIETMWKLPLFALHFLLKTLMHLLAFGWDLQGAKFLTPDGKVFVASLWHKMNYPWL
jgi:hypothetical protein